MTNIVSFNHPRIGELRGSRNDDSNVVKFLGLQYATIQDRFAPAELKQYDRQRAIDCTKPGPQASCFAPGPDAEFRFLQHGLEYDRSLITVSDIDCLNLNITAPGSIQADRGLPVLAFIHGGGFSLGSPSLPQYDMARLVQLSVGIGMPMIVVSIGYRLSALGFLTSQELRTAGYKPNNGLRDQRTALQWIQQHISGFGGDPSNVTLMGQSAGAVSTTYHLHSEERLFTRFMLMSGSYIPQPPSSLESAEENYAKAIKALDLEALSPSERINALLIMPAQELCAKCFISGVQDTPVKDNDFITSSPSFTNFPALEIPALKYCKAALIGDCQFDGAIRSLSLLHRKENIASAFCTSMTVSLASEVTSKLLTAYDLTPNTPDASALYQILSLANDISFYAPTLSLASKFSSHGLSVHIYRFNEPNPWEGPFQGQAIHIQDLAWLLQNFREFLDERQRDQERLFAEGVVGFVSGKTGHWEEWTEEKRMAMVVEPEGKCEVLRDEGPRNGRREVVFSLAREVSGGMDALNEATNAFMRS